MVGEGGGRPRRLRPLHPVEHARLPFEPVVLPLGLILHCLSANDARRDAFSVPLAVRPRALEDVAVWVDDEALAVPEAVDKRALVVVLLLLAAREEEVAVAGGEAVGEEAIIASAGGQHFVPLARDHVVLPRAHVAIVCRRAERSFALAPAVAPLAFVLLAKGVP